MMQMTEQNNGMAIDPEMGTTQGMDTPMQKEPVITGTHTGQYMQSKDVIMHNIAKDLTLTLRDRDFL